MRKNSKKGFTIVELVIVIAVIAILAAVMIPTFSGAIAKARESAAYQRAAAQYKAVLGTTPYGTIADADKDAADAYILIDGKYLYAVNDGAIKLVKTYTEKQEADATTGIISVEGEDLYTNLPGDKSAQYVSASASKFLNCAEGADVYVNAEYDDVADKYVPVGEI